MLLNLTVTDSVMQSLTLHRSNCKRAQTFKVCIHNKGGTVVGKKFRIRSLNLILRSSRTSFATAVITPPRGLHPGRSSPGRQNKFNGNLTNEKRIKFDCSALLLCRLPDEFGHWRKIGAITGAACSVSRAAVKTHERASR